MSGNRQTPRIPICCLIAAVLSGCGGELQFSAEGRRLLEPLQTAISAKNLTWLGATEERIKAASEKRAISEAELTAMDTIITRARSGDWKGAQQDVFALSDGQRATSADVARLANHPRSPPQRSSKRR